jgi:phage tail sheath protein FI
MSTMAAYTYPGVYVEPQNVIGPIVGVGTSTAAFIGPAQDPDPSQASGPPVPLFTPTIVTNWTQFTKTFGNYIYTDPLTKTQTPLYMAYAVKGFFDNGGTTAYIVRVGTGQCAYYDLLDRDTPQAATLRVKARQTGPSGQNIAVAVSDGPSIVPLSNGAIVHADYAPISLATGNVITLAKPGDTQRFRPGDTITIDSTTGTTTTPTAERAVISQISGQTLVLQGDLSSSYTSGAGATPQYSIRVADLTTTGIMTFRVDHNAGIEPGSVIELEQQPPTTGTTPPPPPNSDVRVVNSVSGDFITLSGPPLAHAYSLAQGSNAITIQSVEFTLTITNPPNAPQVFSSLSMDSRHSHYWGAVVNSPDVTLTLPQPPDVAQPPNNLPSVPQNVHLTNGGTPDNPAKVGPNEYQQGLDALVPIQDVQLICVPGMFCAAVQQSVVNHCELLRDRFAILDAGKGFSPEAVQQQVLGCRSNNGFASLYYPWIQISDPATGGNTLLVPPSGHIAGIYARVDAQRGVHKAPANELITGAIGLETLVDNTMQGLLNLAGIDVLRIFPGQSPAVWGARTTAPQERPAWMHNCVRRLFIFVETSLKDALRPWVFEPNDIGLWKKLDRTITEFLSRVWRSGALAGNKASDAFYVKIDEELNPPAVRDLGQVIIEIGMAPVHPAEFVVVRIGMWEGGASVTES